MNIFITKTDKGVNMDSVQKTLNPYKAEIFLH